MFDNIPTLSIRWALITISQITQLTYLASFLPPQPDATSGRAPSWLVLTGTPTLVQARRAKYVSRCQGSPHPCQGPPSGSWRQLLAWWLVWQRLLTRPGGSRSHRWQGCQLWVPWRARHVQSSYTGSSWNSWKQHLGCERSSPYLIQKCTPESFLALISLIFKCPEQMPVNKLNPCGIDTKRKQH